MKAEITMVLEREARKSGGDRYKETGTNNFIGSMYVNQNFTRPNGAAKPIASFKLTLEREGE